MEGMPGMQEALLNATFFRFECIWLPPEQVERPMRGPGWTAQSCVCRTRGDLIPSRQDAAGDPSHRVKHIAERRSLLLTARRDRRIQDRLRRSP